MRAPQSVYWGQMQHRLLHSENFYLKHASGQGVCYHLLEVEVNEHDDVDGVRIVVVIGVTAPVQPQLHQAAIQRGHVHCAYQRQHQPECVNKTSQMEH